MEIIDKHKEDLKNDAVKSIKDFMAMMPNADLIIDHLHSMLSRNERDWQEEMIWMKHSLEVLLLFVARPENAKQLDSMIYSENNIAAHLFYLIEFFDDISQSIPEAELQLHATTNWGEQLEDNKLKLIKRRYDQYSAVEKVNKSFHEKHVA